MHNKFKSLSASKLLLIFTDMTRAQRIAMTSADVNGFFLSYHSKLMESI